MQILRRSLLSLLAACTLTAQVGLIAQSPAPGKAAAAAPAKIPALFLSDIHLDPFADPAKAARLNAAPAAEWPAILSAPDSPTQAKEFAALQEACPTRGIDTPYVLWQSSLTAIRADAARARFITLSGDLLAHSFDCKYKALLPTATPAQFLAFTEKTVRTIVFTLRAALPGVPLYIALGNNDSGCGDYQLDAAHDAFLGYTAKIVAESLSASLSDQDRAAVLSDFAAGGYYSVPLAAVPHTRLLVLDDLFFSANYSTCSGQPDHAPAAAQLAWLAEQLSAARQHNERVWVMGHIPPGVDLYSTARNSANVCAGARPQMFLASESLAELLARNADVVRLALFGHTHADEMRLLTPDDGPQARNHSHIRRPGQDCRLHQPGQRQPAHLHAGLHRPRHRDARRLHRLHGLQPQRRRRQMGAGVHLLDHLPPAGLRRGLAGEADPRLPVRPLCQIPGQPGNPAQLLPRRHLAGNPVRVAAVRLHAGARHRTQLRRLRLRRHKVAARIRKTQAASTTLLNRCYDFPVETDSLHTIRKPHAQLLRPSSRPCSHTPSRPRPDGAIGRTARATGSRARLAGSASRARGVLPRHSNPRFQSRRR